MDLTAGQRALRDTVREFAREEVRPVAARADREESFPEAAWDGLADRDLTGLTVPEEHGGLDAGSLARSLVYEELAGGALAVATALSVHSLATSCIAAFGDERLRERWLPEMATGRPVGAFALSEPHAGSDPAAMGTVARRVENDDGDKYVLDGTKQWITNGERAGVVIVFARTDPDDRGSVTQFLVPKSAEGLEVGPREDKLGLRASDTTSLVFDGVEIPAENRLTEEGKGLSAALSVLTGGRIAIASQAVGLAQHALDETTAHVGEREESNETIGDRQAVRHTVAEMHARTRAARLLTRDAARRADAGEDARTPASTAKYVAGETAVDVAREAVQRHGTRGYTAEADVERLYRDAKITTIYEGTTEIQKNAIARELLD